MTIPDQVQPTDGFSKYRTSINGLAWTVPPVLSAVDMVGFVPYAGHAAYWREWAGFSPGTYSDADPVAALFYLPHRIASATRIRWRYTQQATALTGNYVFGIYDTLGVKIVDTGSVALTGAALSRQARSEAITAHTLESGPYYVLAMFSKGNAGTIAFSGVETANSPVPNVGLRKPAAGFTAPSTIADFTDTTALTVPGLIPLLALSVA